MNTRNIRKVLDYKFKGYDRVRALSLIDKQIRLEGDPLGLHGATKRKIMKNNIVPYISYFQITKCEKPKIKINKEPKRKENENKAKLILHCDSAENSTRYRLNKVLSETFGILDAKKPRLQNNQLQESKSQLTFFITDNNNNNNNNNHAVSRNKRQKEQLQKKLMKYYLTENDDKNMLPFVKNMKKENRGYHTETNIFHKNKEKSNDYFQKMEHIDKLINVIKKYSKNYCESVSSFNKKCKENKNPSTYSSRKIKTPLDFSNKYINNLYKKNKLLSTNINTQ